MVNKILQNAQRLPSFYRSWIWKSGLFFLIAGAALAQNDRGLIAGTILDASGALVPGAIVRATNVATNVVVQSKTNGDGVYTLPFLPIGQYRVEGEKAGFKRSKQGPIDVRVGDRITLQITLEVGGTADTVNVSSAAPVLDDSNASLGMVADSRRITELPIEFGAALMFQYLAPGFSFVGDPAGTHPYDSSTADGTVNGSQDHAVEEYVDGVPANWKRNPAWGSSVEFIQEYKVTTLSYDASQGHSSGAWVDVSVKQGTNQFHGSVSGYYQNRALNANLFFNNSAGLPKPAYVFNREGVAVGGPVIKNKTFFFGGYERIAHNSPNTSTNTVPTAAERKGDFSALLALGASYQLYDPASTTAAANGRYGRIPIPGNMIPANRISPAGQTILDSYPLPNQVGAPNGTNNSYYSVSEPDGWYTWTSRVDEMITDKQRIYGRVYASSRHSAGSRFFPGVDGSNLYRQNAAASVDYVNTINSQTVIDGRFGVSRFTNKHVPQTAGFDLTTLGFPASLEDSIDPRARQFPNIQPAGYTSMDSATADSSIPSIYTTMASVSRTQGKHLLRAGVDYRVYQVNAYNLAGAAGTYTFGTYLNGPLDNSTAPPIGTGGAALLLGVLGGGTITNNANEAAETKYTGLYLQDDWKVSRRLTLNLGVRYEYEGPITERYNRSVAGFDFNSANPAQAAAQANYALNPVAQIPASQFKVLGGLTFAGVNGVPRGLYSAPKSNLAPRIGLAYLINDKTVFRAGYGIYYDELGIDSQETIQSGFSQNTTIVPSLDNGVTFQAGISNPFPTGIQQPTGSSLGLGTFLGQSVTFFDPKPRMPYVQRWSMGFQRQLPGQVVLVMNYVGSKSTHLELGGEVSDASMAARQLDAIPNQYLSTSPVRDQTTINLLSQAVPNPFYPTLPGTSLSGTTVALSQLLRPYPQFTGVAERTTDGYSSYNSMQTEFQRRFSKGFTVHGAWTWSKNMAAISFLNGGDPRPYRQISPDDRPHRVTLDGIYELPFGQGHPFASQVKGVPGKLVGGWQVQAIYEWQTGQPLGFGNFLGTCSNVALPASQRTVSRWFNTSCFNTVSAQQLASNLITESTLFSSVRSAPFNYLDVSAIKKTRLTERFELTFRADFINALNHTVFSAPNTSPTSGAFGTVSSQYNNPRTIQGALILRF